MLSKLIIRSRLYNICEIDQTAKIIIKLNHEECQKVFIFIIFNGCFGLTANVLVHSTLHCIYDVYYRAGRRNLYLLTDIKDYFKFVSMAYLVGQLFHVHSNPNVYCITNHSGEAKNLL